jgi:predicted porin
MQKKIIALAIAGLASTAAFAQSNVTIYGVVDAAYVYTGVNGGNTLNTNESHSQDTSLIQSGQLDGSRIGLKGTEDLGNGLKAVFVL